VRLFAAVYPPAAALDELAAYLARVELPDLRLVPREQWHLTTAFYGEVAESGVAELTQRLARAAERSAPLQLALAGAGAFPRPRAARQLWIGVAGDRTGLARLAERCAAAGRRAGLALEKRGYRPHLTLGRPRPAPADLSAVVAQLAEFAGLPFAVDSVTLVKSTLGASVVHEPIAQLELTG
jgi:2'-5' RNA ligase